MQILMGLYVDINGTVSVICKDIYNNAQFTTEP